MRRGGFMATLGRDLEGHTIGLLGLGRLGGRVAQYARAFGMRVIAWSENLTDERCREVGAERAESKDALLRAADVVSIHLLQSPRTLRLIGARELRLMKPSAILVNTSRGPIVDEAALVAALARSPPALGGYAGDVYEIEPLPPDHALRRLDSHAAPGVPSVVLSPHVGYVTLDAYRAWFADAVEDIVAWADTGRPKRVLRPHPNGYNVHRPSKAYPKL